MAYRRGRNFSGGWSGDWGGRPYAHDDVQPEGRYSGQQNVQALAERVTQLQAELSEILDRIKQLKPTLKGGKGE
jgi:hypothetical protein